MVSRAWLPLSLCLLALGCGSPQPSESKEAAGSDEPSATEGGPGAAIKTLHGRGGLSSPELAEGQFLGEGAKVLAGQRISTPGGLRAELELVGSEAGQEATQLRLDEHSEVKVPATGEATELLRGRAVLVTGSFPAKLTRADATLELIRGRAQITSLDDTRTEWSLLEGEAILRDETGEHALQVGAPLETPLPRAAAKPGPVTLAPLEEARWSDAFDPGPVLAHALPPGVGSLTARRPNSTARSQPLRIVDQKVRVTVRDRVAYTEIEQAFFNDGNAELEGTYRFPLPSDASIAGLQLLVGDRWMEGAMVEKQRARRIFKSIVDRVVPRDPALLEWEQGSIFKLKIFPIPAKGQRRVRLSYTQKLEEVGEGRLRYRYPMGGSGTGDTQIENFDFEVMVDASNLAEKGPEAVVTPMLDLQRRNDAGHLVLSHQARDFVPTHELGVDLPAPTPAFVTHRDRDGQNYFMLTMRPDFEAPPVGPIDYVFVVDRSHGTAPELWNTARGVVDTTLASLGPDDRVAVLACDTACDAWKPQLGSVDPTARKQVDAFLGAQELGGASDIGAMLARAAAYFPGQSGGQRVVMYLGDGVPSSGELSADGLVGLAQSETMRGVRLQAVALGSRADGLLLDALTRSTGGDLLRAGASDDLNTLARELQFRARVPVLDDLELQLPDGAYDVHPAEPPPLRNGEALVVMGKLPAPSAWRPHDSTIALSRRSTRERYEVPVSVPPSGRVSEHPYLPRLWAAAQIAHLTTHQGYAAKSRIVELSEAYTVLSRYTALLALEDDAMYRRFGVKRRANQKDQWRGELSAASGLQVAAPASTPEVEAAQSGSRSLGTATERASAQATGRGGGASKDAVDSKAWPAGGAPEAQARPIEEEPLAANDPAPSDGAEALDLLEKNERRDEIVAADEDADSFDFDAELEADASKADAPEDSPRPRPGAAPSAPPASKPMRPTGKKSKAKRPTPDATGSLGTSMGDVPQIAEPYPMPVPRPSRPRLRIRAAGTATDGSLGQLQGLLSSRDAKPGDRNAHRRLVSAAARIGDPRMTQWAADWAAADPDHGRALIAQADALARSGHAMTFRAYESAAEARPFDRRLHEWLAEGLEADAQWERACSHRRAVVSIDPKRTESWKRLARCELGAGHTQNANSVLRSGQQKVSASNRASLSRELARIEAGTSYKAPALPSRPAIRATLEWQGEGDFDIAFIDARGRRLSAMHAEAGVRGRREAQSSTLAMRKYQKPVYVEVSRRDGGSQMVPMELTIKTPDGRRRFKLEFSGSQRNQRVARVYRR